MAFLFVRYDDGKPSTYTGLEMNYEINGKKRTKRFNTGDAVIDFYNYMRFLANASKEFYAENYCVSHSSSVDHFIMDSNKISESHFDPETGAFLDWYSALERHDHKEYTRITEKCPRCWHTKKMKSFNDVKAHYKKHYEKLKKERASK